MSLPVLILDLDGTIIGDITYLAISHNLLLLFKKQNIKSNNINLAKLYSEKTNIIRPFFTKFIKYIQNSIPNILIYIYTASEKNWALKEIGWIEKECNIKFQRPIFHRDFCILKNGTYLKSVAKIFPKIKLQHKNISIDNFLIIDNNKIFLDAKNILICPHYNYQFFIDIWSIVPKTAIKNTIIYSFLINYIKLNYINPCSSHILNIHGKEELKSRYHEWFFKKYKELDKNNSIYKTDVFWKELSILLQQNYVTNFYDNNFKSFKSQIQKLS
jgi:hypothetical protein